MYKVSESELKEAIKEQIDKISAITKKEILTSIGITGEPRLDNFSVKVRLYILGAEMACTELYQFVGNCGMIIATKTYVSGNYRGRGIGKVLQEIKEAIARRCNYTVLLATTNKDSPAEDHILEKSGSKETLGFINKRTGNKIKLWTKIL